MTTTSFNHKGFGNDGKTSSSIIHPNQHDSVGEIFAEEEEFRLNVMAQTTKSHPVLSSRFEKVLERPGGKDNISGLFGSAVPAEPSKKMGSAALRNYTSNVMGFEDQENQGDCINTNTNTNNQNHHQTEMVAGGPSKPIKPVDDSFGNLGFGEMPKAKPTGRTNEDTPVEPSSYYNIITGYDGTGSREPSEVPARRGRRAFQLTSPELYNPITHNAGKECVDDNQDRKQYLVKQPPGGHSTKLW